MPLSPKEMAKRSRTTDEDLRIQSEVHRLETSISKSKPRHNTRMMEVMTMICERFINMTQNKRRILSTEFQDIYAEYSPPTIVKAKKLLGVRSYRKAGVWYWSIPKRTAEEALVHRYQDKIEELDIARGELTRRHRQVCVELTELMTASGYFALNTDILKEMNVRGYSRSTILRAKADLNIATRKIDDSWCWIWCRGDVIQWLENRIGEDKVRVSLLFQEAMDKYGWHREVVKMAKEAIGSIRWTMENDQVHWFNLSQPTVPEPVDTRTPTSVIKRDGYVIKDYMPIRTAPASARVEDERVITVDFTGVESLVHFDMPASEEIKTPGGVKIGVFK